MRRSIATVAAIVLVLATASSTLAAPPYQERAAGSEYDAFTSELCGFDVWLEYRTAFLAGQMSYFHAERFRTGPGGSILQVIHYTWTYPDDYEVIGDPESGTWQERFREVLHGSRVWSVPGGGVIYQDAGYAAATLTWTFTPDGETLEVDNEVFHGLRPGALSQEGLDALLCTTLG
ncbi:MAG: hypothetical protein L0227_13845 [Chloroflexi bacterium]|nr:hypothetical protein [Chloroflexota bacterium]